MTRATGVGVFGFALLYICSAAGGDTVTESLRERWTQAYNNNDLPALRAMYADDARLQHGYCAPVTGRDAIEVFWRDDMADGAQTRLEILDSFTVDDLVYINGRYAVEIEDGAASATVGGTYTQIWRRRGKGDWAIYRESWINLACADVVIEPGDDGRATTNTGFGI